MGFEAEYGDLGQKRRGARQGGGNSMGQGVTGGGGGEGKVHVKGNVDKKPCAQEPWG